MATTARFTDTVGPINQGTDNTDRIRDNVFLAPVYAAAITLQPRHSYTLVNQALTGALTLNIGVGSATTPPYFGDKIDIVFAPDGTSRTVTYGTGVLPTAATQVCTTAKISTISLMFNGASWIEVSRSITA